MLTVPSTPDPEAATLVASGLRHILTILAGLGLYHGTASDSMLTVVASALVGIGTIAWALYQKIHAARLAHEGAIESVVKGKPVAVTTST